MVYIPLLNSSTAQLRLLQVYDSTGSHGALDEWEIQLGRPVPDSIWQSTWATYRSATENTGLPVAIDISYPYHKQMEAQTNNTWCKLCALSIPEDFFQCIWDCFSSRECGLGAHQFWPGFRMAINKPFNSALPMPLSLNHFQKRGIPLNVYGT